MPTLFEHAGGEEALHRLEQTFGGPDRFSRELGFDHLISEHGGLRITEEQRPALRAPTA